MDGGSYGDGSHLPIWFLLFESPFRLIQYLLLVLDWTVERSNRQQENESLIVLLWSRQFLGLAPHCRHVSFNTI